ncbi:MAG: PspC domain-containing protein, partial [Actinobacteria bacterium]|nr:PspC domain-containing protein [Actinomycetota bacterium]
MTGSQGSVSTEQDQQKSTGWTGSGGPPTPQGAKRLERKVKGRWVAGVCAGLADYTGVDATLIRLAFA